MKATLPSATVGFIAHSQDDARARKGEQDALSPCSVRASPPAGGRITIAELPKGSREKVVVAELRAKRLADAPAHADERAPGASASAASSLSKRQ